MLYMARKKVAVHTEEISAEMRSAVMRSLGSIKSEAKTAAGRVNAAKAAQARRIDPLSLPCTCTGGDSLDASAHRTTCPRGRLLWQRRRAAEKKAAQAQGAANVS